MACSRFLVSLLMLGQLAVAGLIIGLTAAKLNKMSIGFDPSNLSAKVSDTCLLGTGPNNVNLCYAAYGFAGVSVLATGALSLLLCCTCNLCGLGFLLDVVFSLAGTAWWALAGVLFNYYTQQPEIAALPQAQIRKWIVLLCWVGCGCFGAALLVNLYRLLARCCACCGSSSRDVESGGCCGGSGGHPTAAVYAPAGYPPRRGDKQSQFIAY